MINRHLPFPEDHKQVLKAQTLLNSNKLPITLGLFQSYLMHILCKAIQVLHKVFPWKLTVMWMSALQVCSSGLLMTWAGTAELWHSHVLVMFLCRGHSSCNSVVCPVLPAGLGACGKKSGDSKRWHLDAYAIRRLSLFSLHYNMNNILLINTFLIEFS